MNSPRPARIDPRPRRIAVAAVVRLPQVQPVRGQEAKQPTEHQAVPPVDLGQVIDKGALRLLPSKSVTRHDDRDRQRADQLHRDRRHLGAARPVRRAHRGGVLRRHMRRTRPATIKRPVTFVFNGGPGAASAYLHLGLAGPRLAEFRAGREGPPRLLDNPQTWLQFTDLVMIDPVGSGFSRPVKADGGSAFWGVARDAESLSKVIAQWIADNQPRRLSEISFWARATAASAPPRWRASCAASTASRSPAS